MEPRTPFVEQWKKNHRRSQIMARVLLVGCICYMVAIAITSFVI